MTINEAIRGINWRDLRTQKAWLAAQVNKADCDHPEGLLALLDALQDGAITDGIAPEEIIFGHTVARKR